ncbi:glycoside hydrolase family 18 protein [Christensenella sp. MSJ-20]|uniref:glycoside hydrolase family 18 protein n=1 Tax=Christensenella sp. MSJ-20 TaxID=2841518 RepID=UPI001C75C736|nr:glycoside hydrolase family 18 protein [Christensenella sp. MSJ-20]
MQIHVVQSGQSLYGIAKIYGTTVADIAEANQIDPTKTLVIGQALVIPITGRYYFVQPGDSLYKIGRRFGVPYLTLAQINAFNPEATLPVGLRLYIPPMPKTAIESNAYAEAYNGRFADRVIASVDEHALQLTYVAPFSFEAQADGSLKTIDVSPIRTAAASGGSALMMAVTNLENGAFSDSLGARILNNSDVQDRLLSNILLEAQRYGFRDIHFDFEYLRPEDREPYNAFLRKASKRLHGAGLLMSTALAPKTSAAQSGRWYTAHDYRVHGEVADFVVIMTYEWGYSAGPPMAVSPIGPVRQVLEYAKTEIPATKIMMGQNLYGYDWTLPFIRGGAYARAISPQTAIDLARQYHARIEYDSNAQAPFFYYWDASSKQHVVWFEDARSINAKFDLLKELDLRGISYWKLGLDFPQNWLLLGDRFRIGKK